MCQAEKASSDGPEIDLCSANSKVERQAKIDKTKDLIVRGMNAHTFMKQVNKYYRKRGTCRGFPDLTDKKALELDARATNKANSPFNSRDLDESSKDLEALKTILTHYQDQQIDGASL